ncbi:hypothetical protein FKM82_020817 [Ascaphus truei]
MLCASPLVTVLITLPPVPGIARMSQQWVRSAGDLVQDRGPEQGIMGKKGTGSHCQNPANPFLTNGLLL